MSLVFVDVFLSVCSSMMDLEDQEHFVDFVVCICGLV